MEERRSTLFGNSSTKLIKAISVKRKTNCSKRFAKSWKGIDAYGKKIEFTFQGKRRYKTLVGATFTFVQRLVLGAFMAYEAYLLFSRNHPIA